MCAIQAGQNKMSCRVSWAWVCCDIGRGSIWKKRLFGSNQHIDGSVVGGRGSAIQLGGEGGQCGTVRIG